MISERRLRNFISDVEIYNAVLGGFEVNHKIVSPLPDRNDPNPSFVVTKFNGKLYWKDFGLGRPQVGTDALSLVAEMECSTREDAVHWVWENVLSRGLVNRTPPKTSDYASGYKAVTGGMRKFEQDFWDMRLVPPALLNLYRVQSLRELLTNHNNYLKWCSIPGDPCFHYDFITGFKAYKPWDRDGDKFRSQNIKGVIEGYNQLPVVGDHLFILSSSKDVMVFRRAGYLAVAPTSETSYKVLLTKIPELKRRFRRLWVCYDVDKSGASMNIFISSAADIPIQRLPDLVYKGKFLKDPDEIVVNTNYFNLLDKLPRGLSRYNYK